MLSTRTIQRNGKITYQSPTAFTIASVNNQENKTVYSSTITLSGTTVPTTFTVTNGYAQINGGAFFTGSTMIAPGSTFRLRNVSPLEGQAAKIATVAIGEFSTTWSLTGFIPTINSTPWIILENDRFRVTVNSTRTRYGVYPSPYRSKTLNAGVYTANNSFYGDPALGQAKTAWTY